MPVNMLWIKGKWVVSCGTCGYRSKPTAKKHQAKARVREHQLTKGHRHKVRLESIGTGRGFIPS